jgi:hypothetical protein
VHRRLELLDVGIGAFQRLVLQQHGLHQCIDGVGRLAQAVIDGGQGIGIARCSLELPEPVEELVNELAFLRRHDLSPSRGNRASKM